jgi:glucan phosphoethanolaminetransferase (alkaline phosphatase superfamily)
LKRFLQLLCGLACASYALAAVPPAHKPKPNVLLITIDTVRADHLGCYGGVNIETPTLDALAHDGIVFERAISQVPLTWPSLAAPGLSW